MKANISLALNAILIIAVGYLLSQHLSSGKADAGQATGPDGEAAGLNIVYVNADTLLEKYDYFRQQQEALAQREREANQRIGQQTQALEKEFRAVQSKVQQGLLAPSQIAAEEQRLGKKQQQLMAEQEQVSQELMAETRRINQELQETLKESLDKMKQERGYDYILQYGQGSSVLLASDSLDITGRVLDILNRKEAPAQQDTSSAE